MNIKISILSLIILTCLFNINAQDSFKGKYGTWINIKLDSCLKSQAPFDRIIQIVPRILWINRPGEVEIEFRFEQKRKFKIKKSNKDSYIISIGKLNLNNDTIILNLTNGNVVHFIKYELNN
ncbi:hypothetical protein [Polluticaenibacter yanchengensis]|uniref:Uncharacterized protein n=1 Tax=Polluticaenibacter yanchengensis TaxID=3014562 RepID=A0ABT4UPP7_9BACT|nr:hypothetical protein [Chitinophagaceae bacterium LY-5]